MRAANYLLIPILSELVSLYGTDQLIDLYAGVKEHYNPLLEILGVLLPRSTAARSSPRPSRRPKASYCLTPEQTKKLDDLTAVCISIEPPVR
jgi:hypothetical protein